MPRRGGGASISISQARAGKGPQGAASDTGGEFWEQERLSAWGPGPRRRAACQAASTLFTRKNPSRSEGRAAGDASSALSSPGPKLEGRGPVTRCTWRRPVRGTHQHCFARWTCSWGWRLPGPLLTARSP